jgi:SAM-dependent methyltransferase
MLDVACGQGRHSRQLHSLGYEVTGIDLSTASIAAAQATAGDGLSFYVHDMRQPFWINYFDIAFNFFTSFGYFRTRREHDAAIRTMAQSLKPGGRLVIDYLNVHYAEDHLQPLTELDVEDTHYHITRWMDETHFYKKIEVEHDSFTEPHIYTEKVAKFSPGDFTDMLAYQHMQVTDLFGDYALQPYHIRQSPRMIIVAQKLNR